MVESMKKSWGIDERTFSVLIPSENKHTKSNTSEEQLLQQKLLNTKASHQNIDSNYQNQIIAQNLSENTSKSLTATNASISALSNGLYPSELRVSTKNDTISDLPHLNKAVVTARGSEVVSKDRDDESFTSDGDISDYFFDNFDDVSSEGDLD